MCRAVVCMFAFAQPQFDILFVLNQVPPPRSYLFSAGEMCASDTCSGLSRDHIFAQLPASCHELIFITIAPCVPARVQILWPSMVHSTFVHELSNEKKNDGSERGGAERRIFIQGALCHVVLVTSGWFAMSGVVDEVIYLNVKFSKIIIKMIW